MSLVSRIVLALSVFPSVVVAATVQWAPALKAELTRRASQGQFSGAVLVAREGEVLFADAYGEADRERKVANTVDMKFRFGSMGKMFTGVAVMQLVQAGKVALDAPLGKYLDYPNVDVAKVTLHQLLTHTGGTGDIFGPAFMEHRNDLKNLSDYVTWYGARNPEFAPGSRHEYSNYGYILLGRVIEVVSGQSYDAYVRDHIFVPAGMTSTDNLPENSHVTGLSVPYTGETEQSLRSAEDSLPWRGTSAGGGYSTVRDLLKFATAIQAHQLLDAPHTDLLLTGKVDTPRRGLRYAYGFEDAMLPGGLHRIGHGGGAPGMNGVLGMFIDNGYVVVVLANRDPPAAMEIERFITEHVIAPRP